MSYKASEVATFFVNRANKEFIDEGTPEGITNLKLQKLLYFAQAAYLSMFDKELFNDEIEAWKFGPVVPAVYKEFSQYKNNPIPTMKLASFGDEDTAFLESVWNIYGKYSAAELVNITHNHLPWKESFLGDAGKIITKESIRSYYKSFFTA